MKLERKLLVTAERDNKSPLTLRMRVAEAKGENFKVDLSLNTSGHIVLNIKREDETEWTSYFISPNDLIQAVLQDDEEARKLPTCKYCGELVEKEGMVHAGGCGNVG